MGLGVLKSFQPFHETSSMLFHRDKDQLQPLWGFTSVAQDLPAPISYRVPDSARLVSIIISSINQAAFQLVSYGNI
jgi:hypothetical protein